MKFLFGVALAATAAYGNMDVIQHEVGCQVWLPDWPMHTCLPPHGPYTINQDDATDCGKSADKPCPTNGGECGACYTITYNRPPFENAAVCKEGVCPPYKKVLHVKNREKSVNPDIFMVSQAGWSHLCPYICQGTAECVEKKEDCVYGTPADRFVIGYQNQQLPYPSSCDIGLRDMVVEKVNCGDDMHAGPVIEDNVFIQPIEEGASIQPIDNGASIQPIDTGASIQPIDTGASIQPIDTGASIQPAKEPKM